MSEQNLTVTENAAIGPGFTARMRRWRTQVVTVSVSRSSSATRKPNLTMTLRTWHKRAGLFAFIFMGWLGASGVLINQSADWGYDTVRIDWTWVMSLYSLKPSPPRSGFASDGHWIAATPESTVMDGKALPDHVANPVGVAVGGTPEAPLMFVAGGDKLLLYTPEGARVDELSGYVLPVEEIRRIGQVEGSDQVAIQDLDVYATVDGLDWTPLPEGARVQWSVPAALDNGQRAAMEAFSRPTVSLEHVLVDAHSGRLFGRFGAYLINAVGIAAMLLSISGVWMMWRTRKRRH